MIRYGLSLSSIALQPFLSGLTDQSCVSLMFRESVSDRVRDDELPACPFRIPMSFFLLSEHEIQAIDGLYSVPDSLQGLYSSLNSKNLDTGISSKGRPRQQSVRAFLGPTSFDLPCQTHTNKQSFPTR